jgi:hypothetical protein
MGGDVSSFVAPAVARALAAKRRVRDRKPSLKPDL